MPSRRARKERDGRRPWPDPAFALRAWTSPINLPAPPSAEQRPYSYERHGVTIEDPWHWLRQYPEVTDPDVLAYLTAENDYFEAWAKQHRALIDQLFEEMKGRIKEDDSSVPIKRRRLSLLVGVHAGRAIPDLVPQAGRGRRGPDHLRRAGRGRGQGLFPAGRARGQPRRQIARDPGRRQRLGALPAANPRPCDRQGYRDRDRGRDRPAGVDQRQRRDRVHRGQ